MREYCVEAVCQVAAAAVAIVGLIPAAVLLNPWRRVERLTQLDEIYFGTSLLKSAGVAVAGLVAGYILLRLASQLKSKCGRRNPPRCVRPPNM